MGTIIICLFKCFYCHMIQALCKSKSTNEQPIMILNSIRIFWCPFWLIAIIILVTFSLPALSILTNIANITNAASQQSLIQTKSILPLSNLHLGQNVLLSSKFRRSVPDFEATLNAMKCALRMLGLQVSGKNFIIIN